MMQISKDRRHEKMAEAFEKLLIYDFDDVRALASQYFAMINDPTPFERLLASDEPKSVATGINLVPPKLAANKDAKINTQLLQLARSHPDLKVRDVAQRRMRHLSDATREALSTLANDLTESASPKDIENLAGAIPFEQIGWTKATHLLQAGKPEQKSLILNLIKNSEHRNSEALPVDIVLELAISDNAAYSRSAMNLLSDRGYNGLAFDRHRRLKDSDETNDFPEPSAAYRPNWQDRPSANDALVKMTESDGNSSLRTVLWISTLVAFTAILLIAVCLKIAGPIETMPGSTFHNRSGMRA